MCFSFSCCLRADDGAAGEHGTGGEGREGGRGRGGRGRGKGEGGKGIRIRGGSGIGLGSGLGARDRGSGGGDRDRAGSGSGLGIGIGDRDRPGSRLPGSGRIGNRGGDQGSGKGRQIEVGTRWRTRIGRAVRPAGDGGTKRVPEANTASEAGSAHHEHEDRESIADPRCRPPGAGAEIRPLAPSRSSTIACGPSASHGKRSSSAMGSRGGCPGVRNTGSARCCQLSAAGRGIGAAAIGWRVIAVRKARRGGCRRWKPWRCWGWFLRRWSGRLTCSQGSARC